MYFSSIFGSVSVAHRAQKGQRKSEKSKRVTGALGSPFIIAGSTRKVIVAGDGDAGGEAGVATVAGVGGGVAGEFGKVGCETGAVDAPLGPVDVALGAPAHPAKSRLAPTKSAN